MTAMGGEPTFAEDIVNGEVAPIPDLFALAPNGEVGPRAAIRCGLTSIKRPNLKTRIGAHRSG
jgi:hypothetical protein